MKNGIVIIDQLKKNQKFEVHKGEKKTFVVFLSDGQDCDGNIKIIINGENAKVQILGIIFGWGNQTIKLYTLQDHIKASSISDLFIKSVLFGESKFYYRGLIKIEKKAQKSNAYQKNQNLLLSDKSWADTRPELEILANDVRCTHGATVGKLDENQLYYLETRGLDKTKSSKLLIKGFLNEVIARIPDQSVIDNLSSKIEEKVERLTKGIN